MFNLLNADSKHAAERNAGVINWLKSLPTGSRLLDVGAGEMPFKQYCGHLQYQSQDFGQYDGAGDSAGLQTDTFDTDQIDVVCDITNIPLKDASQDYILCTEVLEHIPNVFDAIRELRRLLAPGGTMYITVPGTSLLHFSPYHFITGFKSNFFHPVFEGDGFTIDRVEKTGSIYSVTALYFWHICKILSVKMLPSKQKLLFYPLVLFCSPIILVLLLLDKYDGLRSDVLEAGVTVVVTRIEAE